MMPAIDSRELVSSDDFAFAIAERWQDSVVAIIDAGKLLLGSKAALDHGEFGAMIENKVPFGWRTANRLMAIGEHSVLSNSTHVSNLPPSWGTVYELTKAPDPILRGWLTDLITSDASDKRFHEWGQSVTGMSQVVERFTNPGSLVCDPFCGAGSTGVASLILDRVFLGIDTDEEAINVAATRLAEVVA